MKRLLLLFIVLLMPVSALADSGDRSEIVLFDGEASVSGDWQLITGVNTTNSSGSFDPLLITEGGYFVVEYTGADQAVYLAFSEWEAGTWSQVNVPASCEADGEIFKATFNFDQCREQYGNADFTAVDQICVGSTNAGVGTTVRRIVWYGFPLTDDLNATVDLFRGSVTAKAANINLQFIFTKHVGGDFDASQINEGSRFYVEYTGAINSVYLALSSHSGATQWSRINPDETIALENGRWAAWFNYDNFARIWGTNFARLDQVTVFTATERKVTLHRVSYFAGKGEPVDTSDGRWSRKDTGIAFIGDSICQNAMLIYGDWNTILGRSDCVNYGIGGQTTKECLARIDELASRNYRMVAFICGINDIGRGHTNEEIVANYDGMIKAIREKNPDCEFMLVSVLPTTSAFYTGQQEKILQLNMAYERYASETDGVTYVDVYSSFTSKAGEYAYPELLSDGLHPNQAGYAKMAEILTKALPTE